MTRATPQIERIEMDSLACWRVLTAEAELLVAQQGAQVLSYRRHGEQPLIWLSEQAGYQRGQSVRGGVPVCWPWFGDLRRNPDAVQACYPGDGNAPAHGLVRGLDWELDGVEALDGEVQLRFSLDTRRQPLPGWPHAARLGLTLRLDAQRLHLALDTENLGDAPLAISQALHTYFAVSDIHQARVEGLDGCDYIETLDGWSRRRQAGDVAFSGETDRIYLGVPRRVAIHDAGWNRRVVLEAEGSSSAVVWNPWIDKSTRLSQFAPDAWQRMLCIETAQVMDDVLHLAPGARHRLAFSLWSEAL
ncbi:glucose-6-phosphate 1-epimerase [Pseudomonas sp. SLBN-26]|jgi:glucose-6-phosphate 1-epimerase|nr:MULTISPECIES: D-hexose-6-phosphate mutarotase [Pseudomonas]MCP1619519.1 glucose-6-phosphate 1-epimerase [Pseudomonas otitidis]MDV3437857.1 D-hexose-6-phosphate mutarotase [Pseudomonas otitidis]MDV3437882.1 D-hexose-6-phosphate mutarotase [Pseudomonas otitidis]TQL08740.1 glucose-6-phosphate 1-epimerase [Pseudomonas sp. SLBN-26]WIF67488.1 D-hexose-6-phosphate mutarotase [Pseudomonas otitidis]